jgi:pimeloyl-ACP methyl ester carboxylesterase
MTKNPIVLVHGYSDKGESFKPWKKVLVDNGYQVEDVSICSYESLTNEVTIKDLAEGFDRALRIQAGLKKAEKFDAIVHSTGMLVMRSWLTTYNQRRERLNRLIGLAPASFGSPLADMGRSFLDRFLKEGKSRAPISWRPAIRSWMGSSSGAGLPGSLPISTCFPPLKDPTIPFTGRMNLPRTFSYSAGRSLTPAWWDGR